MPAGAAILACFGVVPLARLRVKAERESALPVAKPPAGTDPAHPPAVRACVRAARAACVAPGLPIKEKAAHGRRKMSSPKSQGGTGR